MDSSADNELAALRTECYRGIARVRLSALNFRHPLAIAQHRELSLKNVQRLENIFQHNGCLRLEEENVINAVVPEDELVAILASLGLRSEEFRRLHWARQAPFLNINHIDCLSGMHRIAAGDRFLDENDKWWVVRLFSHKTPNELLTRIIESHSNEQKPSDGEVFRKIRFYHQKQDQLSEHRWWACLDHSKPKDLRQLLKKQLITAAFDAMVDMPGLWSKIQLGALHRLLALKCDEEMVLYLTHVAETWRKILRCGDTVLPGSVIDSSTVEKLELLAPESSESDRETVHDLMQRGELFPSQCDETIRQKLSANICGISGLIPSLRTFFEMLKYLEPICGILKSLAGNKIRRTLRSTFMGFHFAPARNMVQVSEVEDAEVVVPLSREQAAMLAYVELWAFCGRHVDGLTAFTPKKESGETRPVIKGTNPVVWRKLARFALSRGFNLPRARELAANDSCSELALEYLQKANPLCTEFSNNQIKQVIDAGQASCSNEKLDAYIDTEYISVERRVGRPFVRDFIKDKMFLFVSKIYHDETPRTNTTLTFVRNDLFTHLFGRLDIGVCRRSSPSTLTDESFRQVNPEDLMDIDCEQHETLRTHCESLEKDKASLQTRFQELQNILGQQDVQATQRAAEYCTLKRLNEDLADKNAALDAENKDLKRHIGLIRRERTRQHAYYGIRKDRNTKSIPKPLLLNQDSNSSYTPPITVSTMAPNTSNAMVLHFASSEAISGASNAMVLQNSPAAWQRPQEHQIEVFYACSNNENGEVIGYSWSVDIDDPNALSHLEQCITSVKSVLSEEPCAITPLRQRIVHVDQAEYLLGVLKVAKTILIGPRTVIETYMEAGSLENDHALTTLQSSTQLRIEAKRLRSGKRRAIDGATLQAGSDVSDESEAEIISQGNSQDCGLRRKRLR